MRQLWITGYGIVSAIGVGKEATKASLLASRSGIGKIRYLETEHREVLVGEVKQSNEEMEAQLGIAAGVPTTRTALMGMLALEEALRSAGIGAAAIEEAAFVSGTTVGGMDKSEKYYFDILEGNTKNEYIKTHDCGACTEMIADHFGRFDSVTTLSTACSSAANAIIYGAELIEGGRNEIAVVGGSECITKYHLNGFNTLRILDEHECRPFDRDRAGLNLGEGAAYIVIETPEHAKRRGVMKPQAILAGYGNACDAYHQTASSPDGEGAYRAMTEALRKGGIAATQIDYVNAHGTGTPNNDNSESAAMRRVFGEALPPISSTKSFTGHTTSASGAIETAICLIAMENSFIPANLNYRGSEDCVRPVGTLQKDADIRYVLCNSFGFGGNDTSILLGTHETEREAAKEAEDSEPIYVYAAQQISIQEPLRRAWMDHPKEYTEPYNRAIEPDYRPYVTPLEGRRMGRLLKRALAVSKEAIAASKIERTEAIITGTGLGCIENTEKFLDAMCREGEQLLKPTHFMQSTHNTIGSLMAIQMKCHGYNATYAHGNISFESALSDAYMQLKKGQIHSAMVGGYDEMTPSYFGLLKKTGYLSQEGEIAGESATSIILGHRQTDLPKPLCRLCDVRIQHKPTIEKCKKIVDSMLSEAGLTHEDIAGVIVGINGSEESLRNYTNDYRQIFGATPMLQYKHLFGESYTATGLGIYAACCCIDENRIPASMYVEKSDKRDEVKALIIFNKDDPKNYTFTLLSRK